MNDDLPSLNELETEFARLARERRRRWRWPAMLGAVAAAGVVGTGVALAATALLEGEPVSNPPGITQSPRAGVGVSSDAEMLAPRVADPDGGPPWGIRLSGTTRSFGCVQVGRVVDGRLGVLGADGAFADDGLFHPLPPTVQREQHCQPKDANGRTYLAVSIQGLPASAYGGACRVGRPIGAGLRRELERMRGTPPPPACDPRRLRIVLFGLLGPEARSVTYLDERGRPRTARTSGPEGAYLVVTRPNRKRPARGQFVTTPSPLSGLTQITYADGTVCRIRSPRSLGGGKACPRVGYEPRRLPPIDPAKLRAQVTATASPKPIRPESPPGYKGALPLQRRITTRFTAPVAADVARYYIVVVEHRGSRKGCAYGASFAPIARDVAAGETVESVSYLPPGCRGTVAVSVHLHSDPKGEDQMPFSAGGPNDPRVGATRLRLPR